MLLESAGARGEAEAVGVEIARLLRSGHAPDEIAIVLRHPDPAGACSPRVLRDMGIPVALESSLPLSATPVGGRPDRALPRGRRRGRRRRAARPPAPRPGARAGGGRHRRGADPARRRDDGRRGGRALGAPAPPPRRACARPAATPPAAARAGPQRPRAGRGAAPQGGAARRRGRRMAASRSRRSSCAPGWPPPSCSTELAALGELAGCEAPGLAGAIEALESSSVPLWRGPATGRVRILDPYRARSARVRALFCLSLQDGAFPSAAPPDPLLSEERRRQIGNPDLRRTDPGRRGALPLPLVRLAADRAPLPELAGLRRGRHRARPLAVPRRDPRPARARRRRRGRAGPQARARARACRPSSEATGERALARALALGGWAFDAPRRCSSAAGAAEHAGAVEALFARAPGPERRPGPLRSAVVLAELGARDGVLAPTRSRAG